MADTHFSNTRSTNCHIAVFVETKFSLLQASSAGLMRNSSRSLQGGFPTLARIIQEPQGAGAAENIQEEKKKDFLFLDGSLHAHMLCAPQNTHARSLSAQEPCAQHTNSPSKAQAPPGDCERGIGPSLPGRNPLPPSVFHMLPPPETVLPQLPPAQYPSNSFRFSKF